MSRPKYCWDTSVFIAWLNEQSDVSLGDMDLVLQAIHKGEAVFILSVVTYTELLRAKYTASQIEAFDRFLKRSNVKRVDNTFPIAKLAEEIRSRGVTMSPKGEKRNIRTADATIMATAILHGADVFHTLEPSHWNLNGSAIVSGLRITPPRLLTGHRALPGLDPPSIST